MVNIIIEQSIIFDYYLIMAKVILHIDLNYFFVRCEEIKNPSLIGKPVAIGHVGRGGIVSTCSYKAREYGVRSGMPVFKALELCENLILLNGDYPYYHQKSTEFFNFLKQFSTIIEPVSIDECYIDITSQIKNNINPIEYIKNIQTKLFESTSLMCSIGVAKTKFLAKMGSDIKKPMGITIIRNKDIPNILYPLKIEDFFGIGKKTSPRLREIGINTIGDLAKRINNDEIDEQLFNILGKFYYGIKDWINGQGDDVVSTEQFDPKSISHSHTLEKDTNDIDTIYEAIKIASKEVSKHAKSVNKIGLTVQLILKDNNFKSYVRSSKMKFNSNDFNDIYSQALSIFDNNFLKEGDTLFRLVGVGLQNLEDEKDNSQQMSIFDNFDDINEKYATKLLVHQLNRKMNKGIFTTAGEILKEKNGNK